MTDSWATSGLDLHLVRTGTRVRAALETALREAVVSGRLSAGTRLPSSRGLAADLGLARNTVAEAYAQLVAEGWLVARQGSGTRVAASLGGLVPVQTRSQPAAAVPRYDLRPGHPDVATFPRAAWLAALRRALATAPHSDLDYGDPRGELGLRRQLTSYLARVRGVRTTPDRLVICNGTTQALSLLADVLGRTGERMAVEEYGLAHHRAVIEARGMSTVALPVDDEGVDVRRLSPTRPSALLATPAHQFPTGVPLSPERRADLVEWARASDTIVIEDDYDGEFRYDRQPVGALQALDPDRVTYCGTTSKSLAPGVRLGWLALPEWLLGRVIEAKRLADHQSASLDQLALAELIRSGHYDRHVRRSRQRYRRRRDLLVAALADRVPRVQVAGIAAGQHVLVELPTSMAETETEAVQQARRRGLALEGLTTYLHPEATPRAPALVVGYATPPDNAFAGAVELLCRVLASLE